MQRTVCTSCKHRVEPTAPRSAWKVASVFFWVAALATGSLFAGLFGLNLVLVPMWLGIAMAVGVAARRASSWTCPECSEALDGYQPQPERPAEPHAQPPMVVPQHA
jgi:predicted RNA-binding Zn-ribbon protein involved in translation (DUF1610 family)